MVNLFLVYTAIFKGPDCIDFLAHDTNQQFRHEHLLAMIPDWETRNVVHAILLFKQMATFEWAESGDKSLLYNHPVLIHSTWLLDVTFFAEPCDDVQHTTFVCQLLCDVLIGIPKPWEHAYFQAFAEGLNLHRVCALDHIIERKPEAILEDIINLDLLATILK
ncbi:hypothetical protein APHAL10511_008630 [Amanita phalloides]|nr:hypothetical protein APHAL10511_008629 [Amanita phalloides]KAK2459356.1 hypothetical protein APHAL10511_008630 [Amanita phalloides]